MPWKVEFELAQFFAIHFHFWTIWRKWCVLGINLWKFCMVLKFWRSVGPIKPASKSSSLKRTQKFISQLWATLLPTYIYDNMSSHFLMLSGAQYKEIAKTSFWRRQYKKQCTAKHITVGFYCLEIAKILSQHLTLVLISTYFKSLMVQ